MSGDTTDPKTTATPPAKPAVVAGKIAKSTVATAAPVAATPKIAPSPVSAVVPMASKAESPVAAASEAAPAAMSAAAFPAEAGPAPAITPDVTPTVPVGTAEPTALKQETMEIVMTTTDEIMSQGHANVEAVIKSSQIWTSGFQDIGRVLAESAQAQFDHNLATWKALTTTKSLKEAFDIQTARARVAMEKAVADTSKIADASMKLAEQAIAPITARMSVATDRFVRPN